MDVFVNNVVPANYKTKTIARDLGPYNTHANKSVLLDIFKSLCNINVVNGLFLWVGTRSQKGYPKINSKKFPDRPEGDNGRQLPLHRLVYELLVKHAPINACICHKSNIKNSITPSDLFEGTYSNNSIHAIMSKLREYPNGEDHWSAKITSADVADMIHLYYANAKPVYEIAEQFGLSVGHTSKVIHAHERVEEARIAREEELSNR